ncbi:hypothetical protein EfmGK941_12960 [Enterococcus faecium]|nr:hypothetical protein EfmGK941_12960 [Enterococcus faecium]
MANDKQLMIQQSDRYKVYHHTSRPIIEHSIELCGAQAEYPKEFPQKFDDGLGYQLMMCRGATTTYDNPFMKAKGPKASVIKIILNSPKFFLIF